MTSKINARLLRAAAAATRAKGKDVPPATNVVHVHASGDTPPTTHVEAHDGRVVFRAVVPQETHTPVLIKGRDAVRLNANEYAELSGDRLVAPFSLKLAMPNGKEVDDLEYPDLGEHFEDDGESDSFVVDVARLATVAACFRRAGVSRVQVVVPDHDGSPVLFRGASSGAANSTVLAALLQVPMYVEGETGADEAPADVEGQLGLPGISAPAADNDQGEPS